MNDALDLFCLNPAYTVHCMLFSTSCILIIVICHLPCFSESVKLLVSDIGIVLENFFAILSGRSILTAVCTVFKFVEG